MAVEQEQRWVRDRPFACRAGTGLFLLVVMAGCGSGPDAAAKSSAPVTLRMGVGNMAAAYAQGGLQQVASNLSFEGLVRIGPDGRPRPWLAKTWTIAPDGLSMTLDLEPNAKFHDGTPVTASVVAQALRPALPALMGEVFKDITSIEPSHDERQIKITFVRPSPFLLESLETLIKKPGAPTIGTGPFVAGSAESNEMRANADYYLGRPNIDRIVVTSYPTMRAAWAELMRNNTDMLYQVGADAAELMRGGTTVSLFSFTRPYQYVVVLNVRAPKFKSAALRRALNAAIDRSEVVRAGFDGQATPAFGLVWPQNWAVDQEGHKVTFDPLAAATILKSLPPLRFTCLVPTDYERAALVVQKQLAAVGITMDVESVEQDRAVKALSTPSFEAVLTDVVGGSSLLRPYELWHSGGTYNVGAIGSAALDVAFDRVRYAASDDDYRAAVANLQKVTVEDPPAIYLAWGERSRAISKRFDVPVEPGRDILATVRLWKPAPEAPASRN